MTFIMVEELQTPAAPAAPAQPGAAEVWRQMPDKGWLLGCVVAWAALFHWLGNSTFGYTRTASLFGWLDNAYSHLVDDQHGYLMPFVVLGLLWWKRAELLALEKRVWWPAFGLLVLAVVLHVFGFLVQQTRVSVIAFFLGLYALAGLWWGRAWLRATFFPMFLLGFCIPLGNSAELITFPLRVLATQITVWISQTVLGVSVVQHGTSILEPSGKFQYEVAAACSGLRSLTAIFALTIIYAFVNFTQPGKRLLMMSAALPLAVAGNVIRLLTIIIAAEAFGQEAGNSVHASGWFSLLPYVPAFLGVAGLGWWLQREPVAREGTT